MRLDKIYVTDVSTERPDPATGPRQWTISVRINEVYIETFILHDPRLSSFYKLQLNDYVRESAHVLARKFALLGKAVTKEHPDLGKWHSDITDYTKCLFESLRLDSYRQTRQNAFHRESTGCIIYIIDQEVKSEHQSHRPELSLQCLKWELLEAASLLGKGWPSNYTLAVSRVVDVTDGVRLGYPEKLGDVSTIKILLVVARDLTKMGRKRDAGPELTQEPLMRLQWMLKTRVLLEFVRPGSLQGLSLHLKSRREKGMHFNIVHFDLHGDESIHGDRSVSRLIFATGQRGSPGGVVSEDIRDVARLMHSESIEHVVMTTCWSAYEEAGCVHSMARQLVRSNVRGVCAVWGPTGTDCVSAFNHKFYSQLLLEDESFEVAIHSARRALRAEPERWPGTRQYRDDFLFVYYSRDNPIKPVASHQSLSETLKSCTRYIFGSSRFNTQPSHSAEKEKHIDPVNNGGIIPLKLLLLELEALLQECRIVYASDSEEHQHKMKETIHSLSKIWLRTNFIEEVHYREMSPDASRGTISMPKPLKKETRHTHGYFLGYRLPPALGGTLHVIDGLDDVFRLSFNSTPARRENRSTTLQMLRKFLIGLSAKDYVIFLGIQDERSWMPKEWVKNLPRPMEYWSHGKSVYEDVQEKPSSLDLVPNFANGNIFF